MAKETKTKRPVQEESDLIRWRREQEEPPALRAPGPGEVKVRALRAIACGGLRIEPGQEAILSEALAESYGKEYVEVLATARDEGARLRRGSGGQAPEQRDKGAEPTGTQP